MAYFIFYRFAFFYSLISEVIKLYLSDNDLAIFNQLR
jgi:hypothetical protein